MLDISSMTLIYPDSGFLSLLEWRWCDLSDPIHQHIAISVDDYYDHDGDDDKDAAGDDDDDGELVMWPHSSPACGAIVEQLSETLCFPAGDFQIGKRMRKSIRLFRVIRVW